LYHKTPPQNLREAPQPPLKIGLLPDHRMIETESVERSAMISNVWLGRVERLVLGKNQFEKKKKKKKKKKHF
jgi:hypothetical protein